MIFCISERAGGHMFEEHVGQTINELTKKAAKNSKIGAASSFPDTRTATKAVQENLRNNAEEIAQWLKSSSTDPKLTLDFSHKYPIGYGVSKGNKTPIYDLARS
jgi:hypothetical protein